MRTGLSWTSSLIPQSNNRTEARTPSEIRYQTRRAMLATCDRAPAGQRTMRRWLGPLRLAVAAGSAAREAAGAIPGVAHAKTERRRQFRQRLNRRCRGLALRPAGKRCL